MRWFLLIPLLAALYLGTFHALVAWRGSTRAYLEGDPADPRLTTFRWVTALGEDNPWFGWLTRTEAALSKTRPAPSDPHIVALRAALLAHARTTDAEARKGLKLTALAALPNGTSVRPPPDDCYVVIIPQDGYVELYNGDRAWCWRIGKNKIYLVNR